MLTLKLFKPMQLKCVMRISYYRIKSTIFFLIIDKKNKKADNCL